MKILARLLCLTAVLFLSACGGSDNSTTPLTPTPLANGIGPAGGTVTGPAGSRLVVPANALATTVDIQIAQSSTGAPALPANRTAVGNIFAFTPIGTAFAIPATATVPFDSAQVPNGEAPQLWRTNAARTAWEQVIGATLSGASMSATVSDLPFLVVTKATPVLPTIGTQPASVSVTAGQPATFTVAATGTAPLAYQWKRNGTDIAGATNATYTIAATTLADNGAALTVVVSNAAGSVTSNAATLTVAAAPVAPSITTSPASVSVPAGQPATFTVLAAGTAPLAYQWKRNGTDIPGANSASFTLATTALTDNGAQFTVLVSNAAGNATSAAATLTVTAPTGLAVPTLLDTRAAFSSASRARVVIDDSGNATAVWAQAVAEGSSDEGVFARRFDAATNQWGAEERLDTGNPGAKVGPAVDVRTSTGDVTVVWGEAGGLVNSRYFVSSGFWFRQGPFTTASVSASAIAIDGAGNALVLAPADDGAIAGTQMRMNFVQMNANGTGNGGVPIEAYPDTVTDSVSPLIAANLSGNAIAVWVRSNGGSQTTVFSRYTASTQTWSTPVTITAPSPAGLTYDDLGNGLLLAGNGLWRYTGSTNAFTRSAGIPNTAVVTNFNTKLGATGNGTAIAVSIDDFGGATALIARRYDPTTNSWSAAVKITDVVANNFRLGTAANGEAVVLFFHDGMFATRSVAGTTTWSAPVQVNRTTVTTNASSAGAATAPNGRYAIVWTEVDAANGGSVTSGDVWGNVIAP